MRYKLYCVSFIFMMLFVLSIPVASTIAGQQESVQSSPAVSSFQGPPQPTSSLDEDFLTWTSRWQSQPLSVVNDTELVGDHVVLNATFPDYLNVTKCEIELGNGFRINTTRELVIPSDPGGQYIGTINHTEFDWVIVNGLERGMKVNIVCNFTNADCDFMVWSGDHVYSLFTYDNNLADMASGDKPETDVFTWNFDHDTMYVGCLNYDSTPGNWTLILQVGVYESVKSDTKSVIYDTYLLDGSNQTVNVRVIGFTDSNETLICDYRNIILSNFFKPKVTVYSPIDLGSNVFNFTWTSTDLNADDVHYYSVWLSMDGGMSYNILARNLTTTSYLWDSTGFMERDNYIVRIRAYSLDFTVPGMAAVDDESKYWPGDYSDGFSIPFSTGLVIWDPFANVGIAPHSDVTFYQDQTSMNITWDVSFDSVFHSYSVRYHLLLNGTYVSANATANLYPDLKLHVSLESLAIGHYNITIILLNPGWHGGVVTDSIIATVILPTPEPFQLNLFTFIVIGSIGIISLVVILIIRDYKMMGHK